MPRSALLGISTSTSPWPSDCPVPGTWCYCAGGLSSQRQAVERSIQHLVLCPWRLGDPQRADVQEHGLGVQGGPHSVVWHCCFVQVGLGFDHGVDGELGFEQRGEYG